MSMELNMTSVIYGVDSSVADATHGIHVVALPALKGRPKVSRRYATMIQKSLHGVAVAAGS
jgi:hypothetical protein